MNDLQIAERIAHTVKGVAGNLSAKELQRSAAILEENIKKRCFGNIDDVLSVYENTLINVIHSIEGIIKQEEVSASNNDEIHTDLVVVKPLIKKLEVMLADKDIETFDVFAEITEHLSKEKFSKELNQLEELIDMCVFDQAQIILKDLSNKINIT